MSSTLAPSTDPQEIQADSDDACTPASPPEVIGAEVGPSPPPEPLPRAEDLLGFSELAGLAYFQVDADRNIVAMSPELEAITGFSSDEVVGRSCLNLIRCEECLKGCGIFRHGQVKNARLRIYTKDGTEVDVFKSGRVFSSEDGDIEGAVEVVRLTGGRPTRRTLPEEGSAEALLSALGRGYVAVDGDFRIVSFSSGLARMLDEEPDALVGHPLARVLGEDLFGPSSDFRAAVERGQRREGWRAFLGSGAGTRIPVSISVGPLDPTWGDALGGARYTIMVRPEQDAAAEIPAFQGLVARSPAMQRIFRVIELLQDNDSTVLITGESGTGKELVARALHDTSHRADGPLVVVNCAAIPSELLESELFGHVRGAFTGAVRDRPGRFELADGGTLFLDEIGDLALGLQSKLLRFLQEHTIERVGDARTKQVDVRVIAATHVNLVEAVAERRFREDLYYRLRVVPIEIPPLRERREDLELLIRFLMDRITRVRGRALRLAPSASRALFSYPWPGNVREMESALEYAITVCDGQTIHVSDLPREVARWAGEEEGGDGGVPGGDGPIPGAIPSGMSLQGMSPDEVAEVSRIRAALERARYRRGEAAALLGVSRTTLWRKMKQYRM